MNKDFNSTSFPYLETKRLLLRDTTIKDAEAVFTVFSDSKVTQFHDIDTLTRIDDAITIIKRRKQGFESGRGIRWGIALKEDNYLIGSCGFTWIQELNAAEVGYELASQFWQQGIMSEALNAILKYGFESKGLEFIIAEIMLNNLASRKLLQKLGFQSQKVLEKHGFWKGEYHDLERFILTEDEFRLRYN
ncbi:MAG: GNAT family N-acetyltransferase [Cyanobacteria bacterium J06573_2]